MSRNAQRLCLVGVGVCGGIFLAFVAYNSVPSRPGEPPAGTAAVADAVSGKQLYENHCLQCHGDKGTGDGPAARFLYPKPRDFSEAKFRLVTTENRMPSDQDLLRVISHGMPGSAMIPFAHLSEPDRLALAGYVRELAAARIVDKRKPTLGPGDDVAELTESVKEYLQPKKPIQVALETTGSPAESAARGAKAFLAQGCVSCHGATGKGDGVQEQKDDTGMPTRPRDFTQGIFKGGRDKEQLYARVILGMPGTPMPASGANVNPADLADMVNYMLSLSAAETGVKFEHQRRQVVAKRAADALTQSIAEDAWKQAPATTVVVSPLWWRDYLPPELTVQALHDGQTIALRLGWKDGTRNDSVMRSQDFEDMASVQFFKGSPEPFLGMGSATAQADLWLWRSSWQAPTAAGDNLLDDYPFDMPQYRIITRGKEKIDPRLLDRAGGGQSAKPCGSSAQRRQSDLARVRLDDVSPEVLAKGFGDINLERRAVVRRPAAAVESGCGGRRLAGSGGTLLNRLCPLGRRVSRPQRAKARIDLARFET